LAPNRLRNSGFFVQFVKRIVTSLRFYISIAILQAIPASGKDTRRAEKEDPVLAHSAETAHNAAVPDAKVALHPTDTSKISDAVLDVILTSLDDDKAEDVVSINLRGKSEMADFMVIASGRSSRQVAAMAEKLTDRVKQELQVLCKTEGKSAGDWVLIDAGDVIVHVFRPEVREFYQLEKMWMNPGEAVTAKA